jgi:integrase
VESIERGEVKVARESFGMFWTRLLEERRPYLTAGSFIDFETHGRKRLLPTFADVPLARMDEDRVREWLAVMAQRVTASEISPKTVNNTRTCLAVALNEACRRGLIARNPCAAVPALPVDRVEPDYLRLDEIEPYLAACMSHYRPLAQFLIGTGARISEAVAVQFQHLALDEGVVRVYRQRGRDGDLRPTKGKRFRSVQIGPALVRTLTELRREGGATDWVFVCPTPRRGRYAMRTIAGPPNRRTVHDWHEAALVDAGLRDMPLHALRHTAAAAWLATGHPLVFVQRQLGHRSITTTEEHYGHLEQSFMREAVARTETAISLAAYRDDH